jgi:hypothetical protein
MVVGGVGRGFALFCVSEVGFLTFYSHPRSSVVLGGYGSSPNLFQEAEKVAEGLCKLVLEEIEDFGLFWTGTNMMKVFDAC